jgi:hypothetical protein
MPLSGPSTSELVTIFKSLISTDSLSVSNSKLAYDRRPVGQSVLVSGHLLGPAANFSFISIQIIFRQLEDSKSITFLDICRDEITYSG